MRTLAATGLLLVALLAGCSSDNDTPTDVVPHDDRFGGYAYTSLDAHGLPVAAPLCHSAQVSAVSPNGCNHLMTPDAERQGNEVTIAVNPRDPRNIVGGAKDYYPDDAGQCVWDGVYVTHDGGATTYQDRSFDGSPWRLLADPGSFVPTYASQFWCTTDPVAYFDVNGQFYYLLMAYQADPVTGSKIGEGLPPNGALNDWAFNRATQIVAVSSDGGDTFHTFTAVLEGSYPVDFHDKGWVAASKDGVIHVMWLASLLPGNVYMRSTDGGQSYTQPVLMSTTLGNAGQGSFVDVGTDKQVYATWTSGAIYLRRSADEGATFDDERAVLNPHIAGMEGLSSRDRRAVSPMFATDRNPDSPFADALYYVWQDTCTEPTWTVECPDDQGAAVYVSASYDQGDTFSVPVRVSGVPDTGRAEYEIFPAISVSPGGVVDVSWMDTEGARDVDGHPTFEQHYAYSLDGGKTWSTELSIRDAADGGWDPALSHHQNGMIFFGDYNDIDSSWQAAHPVWPDTRDGAKVKVYTATMQRPWFAEGWDATKRSAAETEIAGLALE